MDYLKEAVRGTRNHRELLLEYAKRSGGYKPSIMPVDGDDKVAVQKHRTQDGMSYFVSLIDTPVIEIFTDLCPDCRDNNQDILNEFWGKKCPYRLLCTIDNAKCGHENWIIQSALKHMYFAK